MKATIISAGTIAALASLSIAGDWTYYHGPQSNRVATESISLTKWPAGGPKVDWKIETPLGFSSITSGGGHVYTVVQKSIDGLPTEVCLALSAKTGKEVWSGPMGISKYNGGGDSGARNNKGGDGPRSTPTFDNGKVYALDSKLKLFCFDAKTGSEIWNLDILKKHNGRNIKWSNAASPLIDGDLVFVAGGGAGESLLAVDKNKGNVVWKKHDETMTHASPIVAEILGVRQIIFFAQSGLVAVSPKSGDLLWSQAFPYKVSTAASPVVFEDIVYCSAGYGVGGGAYRISKSNDGQFKSSEVWRKPNKVVNHWSTPVCKDGYLYGMFGFKEYGEGPLACVDIRTGNTLWQEPGFGPGNVILAGDQIIALADNGNLVLADANPKKYRELARAKILDGKCWSSPSISNGKIYIRSTKEAASVDVSGK